MKKSVLVLVGFFFLLAGSAHALSIDVFEVTGTDDAGIQDWVGARGNVVTVIEDFEDVGVGWYNYLDTAVGSFGLNDDSRAGRGATSHPDSDDGTIKFEVRDTPHYGRFNTTPEGGSNYLDSADISSFTLMVKENSFHNLFFFMTDPGDVEAFTDTEAGDGTGNSVNYTIPDGQDDASLWFVGIDAGEGFITSIKWTAWLDEDGTEFSDNDGFGLDGFTTVAVPEPAITLLLAFGLAGVVFFARRRSYFQI